MKPAKDRRHAFTLVELLVVIAIVTILMAISLPAFQAARERQRAVLCMANLHGVSQVALIYTNDNNERFFKYFIDDAGGRQWWFGYETGGPGFGSGRPLDKSRGPLAQYMTSTDDRLQCPSFPFTTAGFNAKFTQRSASYGYNIKIGGGFTAGGQVDRRSKYTGREDDIFLLADGILFEPGSAFSEGFYITYNSLVSTMSGYAHFRHKGAAQMAMLDGTVKSQELAGAWYPSIIDGGRAGNLVANDGSNAIYGF